MGSRGRSPSRYIVRMKLIWAICAYLVIGLVLAWGILLTVKGQPWLLIIGFLAYLAAFVQFGCRPKNSH